MSRPLSKSTELALAALLDLADGADAAPIAPSLHLKALLWLLYSRSDRSNADTYARFWTTMTEEGSGTQAGYGRSTYARTYWTGIARTLGAVPERIGFDTRIKQIGARHQAEIAAALRRRR